VNRPGFSGDSGVELTFRLRACGASVDRSLFELRLEVYSDVEPTFAKATVGNFRGEATKVGGADGGRTRDLLNAIQARSQLRHSPTSEETLILATTMG
jgi:hypothetical protein